ncbi:DUF5606 domain-containing protein [Olivibacter ginsenosidimutans]|uniref:DUF5606 domain-containing protein n=1 Tax=Olivibacter ginsenosidimutans TaxID=1176537 RepID=A0ABP9BS70_9SPHI
MNLRGIVSVTGKPGLFKLIGQNKTGFILESLDEKRVKIVVNLSTAKMASLEDITIFGLDDDIKLSDILERMKGVAALPDVKKDNGDKLRSFFKEVAPSHDEDRVYTSDIKKIINWFGILNGFPLFDEEAPVNEDAVTEQITENKDLAAEGAK